MENKLDFYDEKIYALGEKLDVLVQMISQLSKDKIK